MIVSLGAIGKSEVIPSDNISVVFTGPRQKARVFIYFADVASKVGRIELTASEFRKIAYLGTQLLADNKVPDDK